MSSAASTTRSTRATDGRLHGSDVAWLTDDQVARIRAAWNRGATMHEIAREVGIRVDRLRARRLDQLADLPARDRRHGCNRRPGIPAPEEVAIAMAEVRRSWPIERWLGHDPGVLTTREKVTAGGATA